MIDEEIIYTIALKFCKKIGNATIKKLIEHLGSAKTVWNTPLNQLLLLPNIKKNGLSEIGKIENLILAEKEFIFAEQNKLRIYHYLSLEYPQNLKECEDSPTIIFTKGNISWQNTKCISIVGTRKMTSYGQDFVTELIAGLKSYPITIVSGLAYGVDITSHIAALNNNIPTHAVLAHGLHRIYPVEHKKITNEMLEQGGLITEFTSQDQPIRENFLQRNRIIAGLSEATIIIESGFSGGSLTTTKYANNYNREVFALPGRVTDTQSKGCNNLIKTNQAHALTGYEDLIYHLNLDASTVKKPAQQQMFLDLNTEEQLVYDTIKTKGKLQIDQLSVELNQQSYELMPVLLNLELQNIIKSLPGKFYDLM